MGGTSVITIGTFDGVHLGHRMIVRRARELADARDARVVALAFDPHPARTLRPDAEPPRLITRDEKLRRLAAAGADEVVVLEPTNELLGQSPTAFIDTLVADYAPAVMIEGPDFRFGRKRQGDLALLRELGRERGFEVHAQEPVELTLTHGGTIPVSSSAVRWLVGHGWVVDAARCLGQAHELTAPVVTGDQRGRAIGVPTANLDPAALGELLVPPDGVYAGTVAVLDEPRDGADAREHAAAISVGTKPTFGELELTVEAHLLDFEGDLYGRTVRLRFARWLRDQVWFPGVEPLKAQLERDIAQTRWCDRLGLLAA